jgi:NADP-dependent 3-hydroxy acid dehydrogenase YdfG
LLIWFWRPFRRIDIFPDGHGCRKPQRQSIVSTRLFTPCTPVRRLTRWLSSIATGAGAGIGLEIVKGLLANPNSSFVIGVDIQTSELDKLLPEHHNRLAVIQGDVSDRSTNQRAIEIAIDRAGKLDCIILNAGILRPVGLAAVTEVTDWKKLFDVNFFGVVHAVSSKLD